MKKLFNVFIGLLFIVLGIFISGFVYAISWPNTPTGEFFRGGFISYLDKALVNTGAITSGVVKKAIDTDNLGDGSIVSLNSNIGIGNSTPSSKLDVSGKTKSQNFQLSSQAQPGNILISDNSGNGKWIKNNYRLKVSSLMVNGGTYGQNCFVMEDTSLKCVGYNGNGTIGLGTNANNHYFPQTVLLKGVKKVYSNNLNSYALMTNGDLYALGGYNVYGELGLGHASTIYFPQKIPGLSNVVDFLTTGAYYTDGTTGRWAAHACALLEDTTVKCWGRNGTGQLGVGDTSHRYSPTQVVGLTNVKKLVMTDGQLRGNTCALLYDGNIKCWGWNGRGSLGVGDDNGRTYPTTVNISNVVDLQMGGTNQSGVHACAVISNGTVKCWGRNGHGQLGNGNTSNQFNPVTVTGLTNVKKIVISGGSGRQNYAITNDNKVYSWGYNGYGELGFGDTSNRSTATLINGLENVKDIVGTGWNPGSTCALLYDGTVKCWGYNAWGQLGVGDASNRSSPTDVLGLENVKEIQIYTTYRSNRIFTCALINDGSVKCWGYNGFGQLGQNNTLDYYIPVTVKNLNND